LSARDAAVARIVTASWLAGELSPVPGFEHVWEAERDGIRRAWRALTALPAAEQPARVAELRAAVSACRAVDLGVS
jgi:hypothetical protein